MSSPVLSIRGVSKRFGPVVALDGVDLDLRAGEVHALLGENGAGKTTLMNVATGIIKADAGSMSMGGEELTIRSPRDALLRGIGMVHQHFRLVRNFTVAENLHYGWEKTPAFVSQQALLARAAALAERFGIDVDPGAHVWELSVGELQRVAILRMLTRGVRVLVLDEPTAVLTPQETRGLFRTLRAMIAEGHTVVFISHKLGEVMEVADRVSVLRRGRNVATLDKDDCDTGLLARLMVGRDIEDTLEHTETPAGDQVLAATGVSVTDGRGVPALRDVNLSVHAAEIVGVAGVAGNGQRELAEVLTGMRVPDAGEVRLSGVPVGGGARAFTESGVGYVPEDNTTGMAVQESVATNAVMKEGTSSPIRRGPLLIRSRARELASRILAAAGLGGISISRPVGTLSGGQVQRLLVQRELRVGQRVVVTVHPTRGLDVAAAEHVHGALLAGRNEGRGTLVISEDLDELLRLSDRLCVLYEGRIVGEMERSQFDRERVGLLMGGVTGGPDELEEPRAW